MTESDLRKIVNDAVEHAIETRVEDIAKRVEQRFLARFGSTTLQHMLKLIGWCAVAAALFFAGKGIAQQ
jgi:hypothetical protein